MNKRIISFITGIASVLCLSGNIPVTVNADADTYLIRDKWGYCKTANYAESEHFVIFYGNNDTTGKVNDEFIKSNLDNYEELWKCYGEYLGMENMNVDIYQKSSQKYKTNVYLTNTGLDRYPEGWAFMSSEDGYGIEIISPDAMLDSLTIAHEFGHVVTMQQKAWVDQDITGAWWEPLANWFREMYIGSDYYTGGVQTCGFEPYLRNMSLAFPHGRNYYEVWPFLVYLSYNPDDLPGLGIDAVKRIISEAKPDEYPFDTITRLFGTDAQTVFGHFAKRMATFDFGNKAAYQNEFDGILSKSPYYWNLFYTVPEVQTDGSYRVPPEEAPMQAGINIIPLNITGSTVTAELKGMSDDTSAGWKACIVTVDRNGKESYSELFGDNEKMSVSADDAVSAYVTVTAMPENLYRVNAFDKENKSSYKNSDSKRRYPYELRISGAEVQQSCGYARGRGHIHINGGGWVSETAKVDSSVYVARDAMVLDNAVVTGNVRIEDHAVVAGNARISDNAVIYGHAIVSGGGWVYDNGWIQGTVKVSGNAKIGDSAVVSNSCTVTGSASVVQKAFLTDAVTVSENATVKGMAYLYGKGSYSGQAILDGDYANEESLSSGASFGWLDTAGKSYTDGLIAGYDFSKSSLLWSSDRFGATDVLIKDAEYQKERTSAKGVISFDGTGSNIVIDDSVIRKDNIQISMGVLWKGGSSGQELFRAGDEKAYISFTPCSMSGNAELTLSDGKTTEKLTASTALPKGKWSKVTIRIIDGKGSLIIDGITADSGEMELTPSAVLSASETDIFTVGKGSDNYACFSGALDYIDFFFKESSEPDTVYSGSEDADDILKGDVNLDGTLNAADLALMSGYLLGRNNKADLKASDISGDGIINIIDLIMLKNILISK